MRRISYLLWMSVSMVFTLTLYSSYSSAINISIKEKILQGNWKQVISVIEDDNPKINNPIIRLIMGHANLAINNNNKSMALFISVRKISELRSWVAWTDDLIQNYIDNPYALYLAADAKARIGELIEAEDILTTALSVKRDFALAFNARGVIKVLADDLDLALWDFLQATTLAPELADAHSSLGSYWVRLKASEGALESFNKALAINPEFALAYHGRGTTYLGSGKFENATQDLNLALQLSPLLKLMKTKGGFASNAAYLISSTADREIEPGTVLESRSQHQMPPGVIASTTGPGKRGDKGGGKTRPPSWTAPGKQGKSPGKQPSLGPPKPSGSKFPWPGQGVVWGPAPGAAPIPPDPTGPGGQGLPPGPEIPTPPRKYTLSEDRYPRMLITPVPPTALPFTPGISSRSKTADSYTFNPSFTHQRHSQYLRNLAPYYSNQPYGVSTKEIGESFVDKGHWPMVSPFGLFYRSDAVKIVRMENNK